jgi:ComEC/Rec2-related protein
MRRFFIFIALKASRACPSVWAAFGASLAFFGKPGFAASGTFCAIGLVLGSVGIWVGEPPFKKETLRRILLAFSFGLAIGASAAIGEDAYRPPAELEQFAPYSITATAISDSRRTGSGNTIILVEVKSLVVARPGLAMTLSWPRAGARISLVTDAADAVYSGQSLEAAGIKAINPEQGLYYAPGAGLKVAAFRAALPKIRAGMRNGFSKAIKAVSGRSFPLAQALLLGIRDDLDDEMTKLFRVAGCSHILALSGQHLSILCMLVTVLGGRIFRRAGLAQGAAIGFALAFTWLAGASPSLFRACLMAVLSALFVKADRRQTGLSVLSVAFCLALMAKPGDGRSLSFQLSYAAMAGLTLFSAKWETLLWRFPPPLAKALSASLAALCATAPLSLVIFGTLYPGGIVAASLSGPLVLGFMWSLLASIPLGSALPFLQGPLASLHESFQNILLSVMEIGATAPALVVETWWSQVISLMSIALLVLFVYCYPYMEYAFHRRRAAA